MFGARACFFEGKTEQQNSKMHNLDARNGLLEHDVPYLY